MKTYASVQQLHTRSLRDAGWRRILRTTGTLPVAVAFAAALATSGALQAAPFFDEQAVAGAVSPTLPSRWRPATSPGFQNGLVYLDETSVGQAMSPPFPSLWTKSAGVPSTASTACPALLNHSFNLLQTGNPQSLCRYHGNVVLVVNTASHCGYTNQYEGLEALYRRYHDRGLVVVGFPSNDFGGQEPGTNKEIAEFCRTNYGIQFPLYEKSSVTKLAGNPFFVELAKATGKSPQWNFHKYLIDRNGKPVASFGSPVAPDSRAITMLIEQLLAQKPALAKG